MKIGTSESSYSGAHYAIGQLALLLRQHVRRCCREDGFSSQRQTPELQREVRWVRVQDITFCELGGNKERCSIEPPPSTNVVVEAVVIALVVVIAAVVVAVPLHPLM